MTQLLSHTVIGEGPPVLLLHGLGGDREQSVALLAPNERWTRIAPDLPGHGETDLGDDEPVTFEHFAARVADLLDELVPGTAVPVVGVSMGAGVALALTAARPDLVARLVLVRPAWLDTSPVPNLQAFEVIAELLTAAGPTAGAEAFATNDSLQDIHQEAPAMAQSLLGQFRRPHAQERARVLARLPHSLPLPDRAAYEAITVDALVLVAPEDPVHPLDLGGALAEWLPNALLGLLPRKLTDPTEHQLALQRAVAEYLREAE